MGLQVNEDKTTYFVSTTKDSRRIKENPGKSFDFKHYNLDGFKSSVYLVSSVNTKSNVASKLNIELLLLADNTMGSESN